MSLARELRAEELRENRARELCAEELCQPRATAERAGDPKPRCRLPPTSPAHSAPSLLTASAFRRCTHGMLRVRPLELWETERLCRLRPVPLSPRRPEIH